MPSSIMRNCADARSPARMRAHPIQPYSPDIWARTVPSMMRLRRSPWPMRGGRRAITTSWQKRKRAPRNRVKRPVQAPREPFQDFALLGRGAAAHHREHDHLGAYIDAAVEVGNVFIGHPDATRRNMGADGPGLVGPVDAIERRAEIH